MAAVVLHVSETTDGGVGVVLEHLLTAQAERGWQLWVAAPWHEELAARVGATGGGWIDWRPGAKPGPRFPVYVRRLQRVLRCTAPDLVHLHTSMAGLCGRLVVRGRVPTLFQPHSWSFLAVSGPLRRAAVAWERTGARWADAVLCVSEDERRLAVSARVRGRFVVIPNGVDPDRFAVRDRTRARADLRLADDPLAVCVGRLHRQKGQHLLLDAWPDVLGAVPRARLALVGDGPDLASLQARGSARTTFTGRSTEVATWLAAADVVVQPSMWEGMSLAVLEAMAAGRSVVATDVPGMREVVRDGSGVVVPRNAAALAEALVGRLQDRDLADREGASGRLLVERKHDLHLQVERVLQLTESLVAGAT